MDLQNCFFKEKTKTDIEEIEENRKSLLEQIQKIGNPNSFPIYKFENLAKTLINEQILAAYQLDSLESTNSNDNAYKFQLINNTVEFCLEKLENLIEVEMQNELKMNKASDEPSSSISSMSQNSKTPRFAIKMEKIEENEEADEKTDIKTADTNECLIKIWTKTDKREPEEIVQSKSDNMDELEEFRRQICSIIPDQDPQMPLNDAIHNLKQWISDNKALLDASKKEVCFLQSNNLKLETDLKATKNALQKRQIEKEKTAAKLVTANKKFKWVVNEVVSLEKKIFEDNVNLLEKEKELIKLRENATKSSDNTTNSQSIEIQDNLHQNSCDMPTTIERSPKASTSNQESVDHWPKTDFIDPAPNNQTRFQRRLAFKDLEFAWSYACNDLSLTFDNQHFSTKLKKLASESNQQKDEKKKRRSRAQQNQACNTYNFSCKIKLHADKTPKCKNAKLEERKYFENAPYILRFNDHKK